jgi:ribosome-interacting GTPase 1
MLLRKRNEKKKKFCFEVSLCFRYAFTTVTAIPGNIFYSGATIQMLDLPGIIEGE